MKGDLVTLRPEIGGDFHCLRFDRVTSIGATVLKGHATLHLPKFRLQLFGCACFSSNESDWVMLPSRAWVDRDGNMKRNPQGKPIFAPMAGCNSRAIQDAFSRAAVAAVDRYVPNWRKAGR